MDLRTIEGEELEQIKLEFLIDVIMSDEFNQIPYFNRQREKSDLKEIKKLRIQENKLLKKLKKIRNLVYQYIALESKSLDANIKMEDEYLDVGYIIRAALNKLNQSLDFENLKMDKKTDKLRNKIINEIKKCDIRFEVIDLNLPESVYCTPQDFSLKDVSKDSNENKFFDMILSNINKFSNINKVP